MIIDEGATAALKTKLAEHPAVVAWMGLNAGTGQIAGIQALRRPNGRPNVFRLIGAGPNSVNIIAKKCLQDDRMVEKQVYKEILPQLSVSSPAYYGHVGDSRSGDYWLFIEDAGKEKYSPRKKEHQVLVPKWLAELHTSASHLQRPRLLPDRSADWFLARLRFIRSTIERQRPMWAEVGDDASSFEKLVSQCDTLESRWHEVESSCERIPSTLVHCDFVPKNICVRSSHAGRVLLPFDWEVAGWGNLATDIAHLISTPGAPRSKSQLVVDSCNGIEAYWRIVQRHWPQLDLRFLERLALVGQVFRMLLSVVWALEGAQALIDMEDRKSPDDPTKRDDFAIHVRWINYLVERIPLYQSRLTYTLSTL